MVVQPQEKANIIKRVGGKMSRFLRIVKRLLFILIKKRQYACITFEGRIRPILRNAKTGEIKWIGQWNHNLIPTVGLRAVARRFGNVASVANEGAVTYGAVGDGTDTPLASATIMQNETERKLIAVKSEASAITHLEAFFDETEANGLITKFALFGEDASGSTDSGTMMEYADFSSSFTKTSNETLEVDIDITISEV